MSNPNVDLTLDDAVAEVLGLLTGLDLTYSPQEDRYRAITMQLNRALRANALDSEWSYYSTLEDVGVVHAGDQEVALRGTIRPRTTGDDSVRLVDENGTPRVWAYFLPRESLHKYARIDGLWASVTKQTVRFSRPLGGNLAGLHIQVPVMREPILFRLPPMPQGAEPEVPPLGDYEDVRQQVMDFDYPDVVVLRAAYYYAQSDPVMQPRAQTIEAQYKDLMYSLIERDKSHTDAPYMNDFNLGISGSIDGVGHHSGHPHSSAGRIF